jgi:hypothetical protein
LSVNIVGDDGQAIRVPQSFAQAIHQGRFTRAHRAADADSQGFGDRPGPTGVMGMVMGLAVVKIVHNQNSSGSKQS